MPLNKQKGNMYEFITHTWNPLGGECPHQCSYCSTNKLMRYPVIKSKYTGELRLIEKELKTNLGEGNFIFVCAQNDLFAEDFTEIFITAILNHCQNFPKNRYLFQTKNPRRLFDLEENLDWLDYVICTTIETNRVYPEIMNNCPNPEDRADIMNDLWHEFGYGKIKQYVTIEPIMDFDLKELSDLIEICLPEQVNIGADSGNNNLPEPSKEKVLALIENLKEFTKVVIKDNLNRIIR